MWAYDRDVLRAGVETGLVTLKTAAAQLHRFRDGEDDASLAEVDACLHRVTRTAVDMGFVDIGRSAQEVEKALAALQAVPQRVSQGELDLLEEALDLLVQLFRNVDIHTRRTRGQNDHDCLARLRAAYA